MTRKSEIFIEPPERLDSRNIVYVERIADSCRLVHVKNENYDEWYVFLKDQQDTLYESSAFTYTLGVFPSKEECYRQVHLHQTKIIEDYRNAMRILFSKISTIETNNDGVILTDTEKNIANVLVRDQDSTGIWQDCHVGFFDDPYQTSFYYQ